MQYTVLFLLCFVVAASQSFFLTSKDIRKILQYFPKAFETEANHKTAPGAAGYYRRRENDYHFQHQHPYRPEYVPDFYDRNDGGENRRQTAKYAKEGKTGRYDYNRAHNDKTNGAQYHSQEDCDHPEHHRPKYPEDRMEKQHSNTNNKAEEVNVYYQNVKKGYQDYKKKLAELEKDYEGKKIERNMNDTQAKSNNNNKKDYVTGVLVSIPKLKNDEDLEGYYKNAKHQNAYLHHLLKTEDEDAQPSRHSTDEVDGKTYLY